MRKFVYEAPEVQVYEGVLSESVLEDSPIDTGRDVTGDNTPGYGGEGGDDDNRAGRINIWDE